ncbi:hypothetical protein SLEP1_g32329 [Rubroshorea leprosula]|uniref:Uncharacterized protein n=1 Tax=Rubroshorea leprosula TaxID=152421 RepID=A0AAV5KCX7_9ROSI|nr:hypothetical protein SLEP1_g32329 [Rubroshorea leprosula]
MPNPWQCLHYKNSRIHGPLLKRPPPLGRRVDWFFKNRLAICNCKVYATRTARKTLWKKRREICLPPLLVLLKEDSRVLGGKVESIKESEVGSVTESEVESTKESELEFVKESEAVMVEPGNPSKIISKCLCCRGYIESKDVAKKPHFCCEHAKWATARTITTNLLGAATRLLGYLHDFIAQHRDGIINFSKFLATATNSLPLGSSQIAAQVLAKMILLIVMLDSKCEPCRNRSV